MLTGEDEYAVHVNGSNCPISCKAIAAIMKCVFAQQHLTSHAFILILYLKTERICKIKALVMWNKLNTWQSGVLHGRHRWISVIDYQQIITSHPLT